MNDDPQRRERQAGARSRNRATRREEKLGKIARFQVDLTDVSSASPRCRPGLVIEYLKCLGNTQDLFVSTYPEDRSIHQVNLVQNVASEKLGRLRPGMRASSKNPIAGHRTHHRVTGHRAAVIYMARSIENELTTRTITTGRLEKTMTVELIRYDRKISLRIAVRERSFPHCCCSFFAELFAGATGILLTSAPSLYCTIKREGRRY